MSKIKSTLDLVLEKTKHLSLTKEEQQKNEIEDITKKINGLIQMFQDQTIKKEEFEKKLGNLMQTSEINVFQIFINESLSKIDLYNDNASVFDLLRSFSKVDVEKIESTLNEHTEKINTLSMEKFKILTQEISEKFGISGSAIVPNLSLDKNWLAEVNEIRKQNNSVINEFKGFVL